MKKPLVTRSEIVGITTRQEQAFNKLVAALRRETMISEDTAICVAKFYLKEKLAKLDVHVGQFTVRHGAFLDAPVIMRAVEEVGGA